MFTELLTTLNILHVFNDGFQASILLLLPFIARDLNANFTQSGALGTAMNSLSIFLALPAGYLATKFGGMRILVIGALFTALGFIGIAFGANFFWLIPLFFLAGAGFAVYHPIGFALVARLAKKESRGKTMGTFTAIGDIGRIGLTAAITYLIVRFGWRNTSILYGIIGLVVVTIFSKFLMAKGTAVPMDRKDEGALSETKLRHLIFQRKFFLSHVAGMLDSFASSSLFIFLPFLFLAKGIHAEVLGAVTATFFVGNVLGKYFLGKYADRFPSSWVFIIAELSMALFIYLLASTNQFILLIGCSIVLGALTKGTVPVFQTMLVESLEKERRIEKAYGLSALLMSITTTVAPIALGYISDVFGIVNAFYVSAAFAVAGTVPAFLFGLEHNRK